MHLHTPPECTKCPLRLAAAAQRHQQPAPRWVSVVSISTSTQGVLNELIARLAHTFQYVSCLFTALIAKVPSRLPLINNNLSALPAVTCVMWRGPNGATL
jgi:hypothetical protein